jgi:preprotein translocase subunit YajC
MLKNTFLGAVLGLFFVNISSALAQAQTTASPTQTEPFALASFAPLLLIFLVFYFLIIRPQLKRSKEHQQLVNQLKIGDKVTLSSGIVGTVREIHKSERGHELVSLEIAPEVRIQVVKSFISEVLKDEITVNSDKRAKKKKHA